jgi:hypothetical protein
VRTQCWSERLAPATRIVRGERASLPIPLHALAHAVAMFPVRATNGPHTRSAIVADGAGIAICVGLTANDGASPIGTIYRARRCRTTRAFCTGGGAYVAIGHLRLGRPLRHLRLRGSDGCERHKRAQREQCCKDRAFHLDCLSITSGRPRAYQP